MTEQTVRREPGVRRATVADAPELVRLRIVMLASMGLDVADLGPGWRDQAITVFQGRLAAAEGFAGFVVDAGDVVNAGDDGYGLAACGVTWIVLDLPSPWSPDGVSGYVANVCTDERFRRRGLSRAVMLACQDWLAQAGPAGAGIGQASLMATRVGEPLYRELGWTDPLSRAMIRRFTH